MNVGLLINPSKPQVRVKGEHWCVRTDSRACENVTQSTVQLARFRNEKVKIIEHGKCERKKSIHTCGEEINRCWLHRSLKQQHESPSDAARVDRSLQLAVEQLTSSDSAHCRSDVQATVRTWRACTIIMSSTTDRANLFHSLSFLPSVSCTPIFLCYAPYPRIDLSYRLDPLQVSFGTLRLDAV